MMEAAFEFSFSGMNTDFAIHLTADGHPLPKGLFINIVVEKCLLLWRYLRSAVECLALVTNVSKEIAIIKFIDQDIIETPLLQFTILNFYDLEEQFYNLWVKACKVLKAYKALNTSMELEHIIHYYHSTEYVEMMRACPL